ncbi:MAG: glycosyltransferase family 4 protein [Phycisphaeraceae bacterium]
MTQISDPLTTEPARPSAAPPAAHAHGELCIAQLMSTYGEGGAERVTFSIGRGLHQIGVRSILIALRETGSYVQHDDSGIPAFSLGVHRGGRFAILAAARQLRRLIREHRIDVLHVHGSRLSIVFAALATRAMRRPPRLWFTWHMPQSVLEDTGLRLKLMRWALGRCENIYGDAQDIIDRLVTRAPELTGRARVFPNAVAETDWTADVDADVPTLVWMARIASVKNPQMFVRAVARLKAEGLRFRVVMAGAATAHSEGPEHERQTRALIDELGIGDILDAPGWVDDTAALLRSGSIGVQTSYHEGLSLTLLEMMMAGLAIVATDCGDTVQAIKHEHTGLVTQPGDEDALVDALRRVITDRELCRQLADAAREVALARYSETAMARRVAGEAAQE